MTRGCLDCRGWDFITDQNTVNNPRTQLRNIEGNAVNACHPCYWKLNWARPVYTDTVATYRKKYTIDRSIWNFLLINNNLRTLVPFHKLYVVKSEGECEWQSGQQADEAWSVTVGKGISIFRLGWAVVMCPVPLPIRKDQNQNAYRRRIHKECRLHLQINATSKDCF